MKLKAPWNNFAHTPTQYAASNGIYHTSYNYPFTSVSARANSCPKLSQEDEAKAAGDEVEVRREDQDKINKFSRLHQREIGIEDELKAKHVSLTDLKTTARDL